MRILTFSDIHGNTEAVRKLISEVSDTEFDAIVFGGDFTNAWFEGLEAGRRQMDEITSLLQSLDRPFYYVYGNRDFSSFERGIVKCSFGKNIDEKDWDLGDYTLTSKTKRLDKQKILVTHIFHQALKNKQAQSLLYLYGHDHKARIYKNYINLGFLYRGKGAHGAYQSLFGCYWFIDLEDGEFNPEIHLWQLKESVCPNHEDQGVFYIPHYWKRACPLCYDEETRLDF